MQFSEHMPVPHERYMQRCFELARLGAGYTAPNPMVGAVIVHEDRIIGEGFHTRYGQAHAEVEAVRSVSPADRPLIRRSTLYVSLEPCSVFGRTPPCTDLILKEGIPKVVISYIDRSPGVNGAGVNILRKHGVEVQEGVSAKAGGLLSAPRRSASRRRWAGVSAEASWACSTSRSGAIPLAWIDRPEGV